MRFLTLVARSLWLRLKPPVSFPLPLPVCVSLSLPDSLWPSPPSPLPLRSPSGSASKSLASSKLPTTPSSHGTAGPQEGGAPLSSRPETTPSRRPSRFRPAGPARSHLVSPARAAVAAIYARRGRGWSFKRRFPGTRRGPTCSLMALVAANHTPLPPPARPAGAAGRLSA